MVNLENVETIDDLINEFESVKNTFYDDVQNVIGQSIQLNVAHRQLEQVGELTMLKFDNDQFTGQGVLHGDNHFVYLSLVSASGKRAQTQTFKSLRREPYGSSTFLFR
jgi:hypothetical protein